MINIDLQYKWDVHLSASFVNYRFSNMSCCVKAFFAKNIDKYESRDALCQEFDNLERIPKQWHYKLATCDFLARFLPDLFKVLDKADISDVFLIANYARKNNIKTGEEKSFFTENIQDAFKGSNEGQKNLKTKRILREFHNKDYENSLRSAWHIVK
jgi:hypothetical protein